MRLGLHYNSEAASGVSRRYLQVVRPPVCKVLGGQRGTVELGKQESPGTKWIGRVVWDPQTFQDYGAFQDRTLRMAREHRGLVDAWEGYNECAWRGEDLRRFMGLEIGLAKRLNDEGFIACIGGFSTGFIEADKDFDYCRGAFEYLNANPGRAWLHFHEYSAPYVQFGWRTPDGRNQMAPGFTGFSASVDAYRAAGVDGWLTLRYRMLRRKLVEAGFGNVRFVITESGIDGGVTHRPGGQGGGWRDFNSPEWAQGPCGDYAMQMYLYLSQVTLDPYVVGVVDFGFGTLDSRWLSFDMAQDTAMLERVAAMQATIGGAAPSSINVAALRDAAAAEQAKCGVRLNPTAALQRTGLAAGLVPTTNEFVYVDASGRYSAQRFESLAGHSVAIMVWDPRTGTVKRIDG